MIPGIVYSWSWTISLDELEMYQFFAILSVGIRAIYTGVRIECKESSFSKQSWTELQVLAAR